MELPGGGVEDDVVDGPDESVSDWIRSRGMFDALRFLDPWGSTEVSLALAVVIGLAALRCRPAALTFVGAIVTGLALHAWLRNVVERAFGLSTSRRSRGTAPDYRIHDDRNGNRSIQAVYNPRLIPPDLTLVFEASENLTTWDSTAPNLSTSTDARGNTVVRLAIQTGPSATPGFLRCRVEPK